MSFSDEELFEALFPASRRSSRRLDELPNLALLSSDDSDEEVLLAALLESGEQSAKKARIECYLDTVHQYSDDEFRRNFRICREVANQLIEQFASSSHNTNRSQGGIPAISEEKAMLSFLWFAGNKCCIRDVAGRFGMGESSFFRYSARILDFFVELAPSVIRFPESLSDKKTIATKFQEISGFPDVLGCIDGTYIPIATPAGKVRSSYVNRHDMISVTMQGICSYDLKFLDVFSGPPSKIYDARIFRESFISKKLGKICQSRFHLLGDAAYSISPFLLTPYRRMENMSYMKTNYNHRFSKTRVKIENAFGLLKQRFRQLRYLEFHTVDKTTKFILSCCVLHNLCIDAKDMDGFDDVEEDTPASEESLSTAQVTQCDIRGQREKCEGETKRDRIAANLL